jgi:DNA-binding IclR family transcriptional regulator
MEHTRQTSGEENGAPAVERAIRILQMLGAEPQGLSAQALASGSLTPRATLYRIIRVLAAHEFVRPVLGKEGVYELGPEMARLGAQAPAPRDLLTAASPVMSQLAHKLGETVKLIVRDGHDALTVAVADTGLDARVTARTGARMPLHIGSSQRLLLAHSPAGVLRAVLGAPLEKRTARTVAEPTALRKSLDKLRMVDSTQGHGEGIEGVGAAATLVRGADEVILGALVAVYIQPGKTPAQLLRLRTAVASAAEAISGWRLPAQAG